jgi:hypothetical protein
MTQAIVYEIPLIPAPQELQTSLNGLGYRLSITWNWIMQCWMLDIYDANLNPLLLGYAMVTGSDLLEQFAYLGFTGAFVVQSGPTTLAQPTFTNLGVQSHLFYVPLQAGS